MNDQMKIDKVKKGVLNIIIISTIYLLFSIMSLISLFIDRFEVNEQSNRLPFLYLFTSTLIILFSVILVSNIRTYKNNNRLRKKTIIKFDERSNNIRLRANSSSFIVMVLLSIFLMLHAVPVNNEYLFIYSFLSLIGLSIIRGSTWLYYKNKF